MRTAALLSAILLMLVASPLVSAGGGHDEGTAEPGAEVDVVGATSPELMPGESWSYNLTAEGTFDYHCHPHPWMLAALNVQPSDGSAPQTHVINVTEPEGKDFEDWTFAPKMLDVRVGDTITWVNVGTVMHRVTQTVGEHIAHVGTAGGTEESHADDGDVHTEGAAAEVARAQPSGLWWIAVAAIGTLCVGLWVKGNKSAP
ncbi:MAG: cupredoxin domain-containing protein [Thermoplasmatota archaeon]